MKRIICAATAIVLTAMPFAVSGQDKKDRDEILAAMMQKKLKSAHLVLDGVAIGDFNKITNGGEELIRLGFSLKDPPADLLFHLALRGIERVDRFPVLLGQAVGVNRVALLEALQFVLDDVVHLRDAPLGLRAGCQRPDSQPCMADGRSDCAGQVLLLHEVPA